MYLVAAIAQEIGPPEPIPAHEPAAKPKMIPVGVRHAVPQPDRSFGSSYALVSLCGSDVSGWFLFPSIEFARHHPASCQRCGQLASMVAHADAAS